MAVDAEAMADAEALPSEDAASETTEERQDRLRRLAETDPEAANAEAIDNMSQNEVIATAINSAGFLCARVTSVVPLGGSRMRVDCTEYRSGEGRVSYTIDAEAGSVEQR